MVAFTKKNTLKKTGFELNDIGFKYRDKYYRFDDVIQVGIARHVLEHKVVLVGSDFHHSVSIIMVVKSGEQIQITEQPTLLSNSKISSVEYIENQYAIIAQKSWSNRLNKYIKQLEDTGYYEYNEWRFYPQQKRIKDLVKDKTYDMNDVTLLRNPFYISVRAKNEGLGSKFIRNFVGKDIGISTIRDTDVFFTLLKHFFNISW